MEKYGSIVNDCTYKDKKKMLSVVSKYGIITKGIAGFYYVSVVGDKTYECKARGIFRKRNITPLVGDKVKIEVDDAGGQGNIIEILPRKNKLIRPLVANIDQLLIVSAMKNPKPDTAFIDRLIIGAAINEIPVIVAFNKCDISEESEINQLRDMYALTEIPAFFISVRTGEGIKELALKLNGRVTAFAGQSGVGKSSLINKLAPFADMETGSVGEKSGRGRHTTRHAELFGADSVISFGNGDEVRLDGAFLVDTPGFGAFEINIPPNEIKNYYKEFLHYEPLCKFQGCIHIREPDCGVKDAVTEGKISSARYKGYVGLYERVRENVF